MWKTSAFLAVSEDNISFLDGRYSFVPNFSIIAGEKASCKFLINVGYSLGITGFNSISRFWDIKNSFLLVEYD